MDKLIDNNIHRISCEVNGCEDMGLSFNFYTMIKMMTFHFLKFTKKMMFLMFKKQSVILILVK